MCSFQRPIQLSSRGHQTDHAPLLHKGWLEVARGLLRYAAGRGPKTWGRFTVRAGPVLGLFDHKDA